MKILQNKITKKMAICFAFIMLSSIACTWQKTSLFNGKNLDGWKIHGTEKWYVDEGEWICESGEDEGYGYLATEKHYDNFILNLEFKQEANGNSGVFFRSTLDGIKISGWQVEVAQKRADLDADATGGIYESYGRGWLIKPDIEKDQHLKVGEWNHLKIKVNGPSVMTWLNGVEMVSITDDEIGKGVGSIALQIHDGGGIRVKWRNIYIEEL